MALVQDEDLEEEFSTFGFDLNEELIDKCKSHKVLTLNEKITILKKNPARFAPNHLSHCVQDHSG